MKKKRARTSAGSFPKFPLHQGIVAKAKKEWQVLCGDKDHWRTGFYSPPQSRAKDVSFLEKHTCVELFMLLQGSITLILDDGKGEYELKLKPMQPVMVSGWHNGYCPNGPHTGVSIVIERDQFTTFYRRR